MSDFGEGGDGGEAGLEAKGGKGYDGDMVWMECYGA